MPSFEPRAVSYPVCHKDNPVEFEREITPLQRERSDSLPEPRHFRRLRRELDLDSDLDKQSQDRDEYAFLRSKDAKEWKLKRVTHRQVESLQTHKRDNVISTEPMGSPTPVRDEAIYPNLAVTHVPWANWTRWDNSRSKCPYNYS